MKKQGVITRLFIVSVCWRKPGHVLGFVVPSTIKLFVLHLVRGDVLPQNNPGLSRAGNDNTCSSLQSAPYSDVKTSKVQEPRRTTGRNQGVNHSLSQWVWTQLLWHMPSDGRGSNDVTWRSPPVLWTNEGVEEKGGTVRCAAVGQKTEAWQERRRVLQSLWASVQHS